MFSYFSLRSEEIRKEGGAVAAEGKSFSDLSELKIEVSEIDLEPLTSNNPRCDVENPFKNGTDG